ncbi:MAG: hypothetical protein IJV39_03190 [Ruminococcus sp.]|nr:hypothetical protein [Ruminococcus sp.]
MDEMQLEALRRAETMRGAFRTNRNTNSPYYEPFEHNEKNESEQPVEVPLHHNENQHTQQNGFSDKTDKNHHKQDLPPDNKPPKPSENPHRKHKHDEPKTEGSPLDFLLKDKETTLILLLIFFLYEDNSDPMLIMALVYLLIE